MARSKEKKIFKMADGVVSEKQGKKKFSKWLTAWSARSKGKKIFKLADGVVSKKETEKTKKNFLQKMADGVDSKRVERKKENSTEMKFVALVVGQK